VRSLRLFAVIVIAWVFSPSASLSQQVSIIFRDLHFIGLIVSTTTDFEGTFPYRAFCARPENIKNERRFADGTRAPIRINDTADDIKSAEYRFGLQLRQCLFSSGLRLLFPNIGNATGVLKINFPNFAFNYLVSTYNQAADILYLTLFIGENDGLQMFQVFPIRIILEYRTGTVAYRTRSRVLFCQRQVWKDFPGCIDAFGRGMPDVLGAEFKIYDYAGLLNEQIPRVGYGQSDPRSLSNIQLIELAPHKCQLIGGSLVAAFTCRPHFVQLTAHNFNLLGDLLIGTAQGAPLEGTNDDSNGREERHGDRRISGKARRAILGGFFCFLGLAFMKGAFEATNQPNPPWFFRCAGWIGWVLGFGTVGYGSLLALSLLRPIGPLG
jgi:hypothetical protein